MAHILKCPVCSSYGLNKLCECGGTRLSPRPAKFSPQDRYGPYRRMAKKHVADEDS